MFKINRNAFNNFLVYILEDSELTLKKVRYGELHPDSVQQDTVGMVLRTITE